MRDHWPFFKKHILAFIIYLTAASLCGVDLSAQTAAAGRLQGEVFDKNSKVPLAGATVQLLDAQQGVITDSLGRFVIAPLAPGKYTVQVSFLGYLTAILPAQTIIEGKTLDLNIELEPSEVLLQEVSIQSFRYENDKFMPISTFSFGRDEIALNPGAQGDIFRAIGMLPGVSSSGGIYSAIAVRGQGVRDNVYMVDDVPLTEVGHLEGNSFFNDPNGGRFSIFAPRVIESAVFQGGAFGTEFGRRSASYLGLTIKEGNKGSAFVDGQLDLLGLTLNYDGPSGFNKATTLFVSARYQNFYPVVKLVGLENLGLPSYGDLIVKSVTALNQRHKLQTLLIVSPERFVRDIDNVYADTALQLLYLPDFKRNKVVGAINLYSKVAEKAQWKNIVYYNTYTSNVRVGKAYPRADSTGNLSSTVFPFDPEIQTQQYRESKLGFRSIYENMFRKGHKIVLGLEGDRTWLFNNRSLLANDTNFIFRRDPRLPSQPLFQVVRPEMVNAQFDDWAYHASLFANYYFEINDRLSGQFGMRADYGGFSEQWVLAPRGNLSYHLHPNHSVSIGLGSYFQDPVFSEIADLPRGSSLLMERVSQYLLSYKGYLRNDLKLMVESWYKDFRDLVVSPTMGTVFRNNAGIGYGYGWDLSITKRLSKTWHGMLSYSFMHVKRNDNDGLGWYDFTFSQPHQFNAMLSYELNKKISFSGRYRLASGRPTDAYLIHRNVLNDVNNWVYSMELLGRNADRLPYFSSLDLRFNYQFRWQKAQLTAFFDVVNVLNRQIANNLNFSHVYGQPFFDGLAIFPTGGLKFEF